MPDRWRSAHDGWPPAQARVALIFATMFFVTGVSTPYLPVWLQGRGITIAEIAWLTILPQILRSLIAPAVGFTADRRHAHRQLVMVLSLVGVAGWALLSRTDGFALAMAAMVLIALSNTMAPLVESIAMAGVRSAGHDYGRMRLWGSAAFVAANVIGGWVASRNGNDAVIWLMFAGALATIVAAVLVRQPPTDGLSVPRPLRWVDAQAVLRVPLMLPLLVAAAMLQGAHGMFYAYGTLHWQVQGIDPRWFGALWGLGLLTEIALFWWSKDVVRTFGPATLLVVGAVLSVFRWTVMALDPPLAVLVPLQVLHGLTFGASHLGAMHVLAKIAPPDRSATAQALYSLVSTLGVACATALAARAYPVVAGAAYFGMAAMAAVGWLAAGEIRRRFAWAG